MSERPRWLRHVCTSMTTTNNSFLIAHSVVTCYCGRECPSFSIAFRLRFARAGGSEYFETRRHCGRPEDAAALDHRDVYWPRPCPSDPRPHYRAPFVHYE